MKHARLLRRVDLPVAAILLIALALVPAVARAGQVLRVGPTRSADSNGLHKSLDAPPDPPAALGGPGAAVAVGAPAEPADTVLCDDDAPGVSLHVPDADPLRGPPRSSAL